MGEVYLDAVVGAVEKGYRSAGLLRAIPVDVGCDGGGAVVGVVFGGDGESAGAQCEEDECLEVHFEVVVEVDIGRISGDGKRFEVVIDGGS